MNNRTRYALLFGVPGFFLSLTNIVLGNVFSAHYQHDKDPVCSVKAGSCHFFSLF